jgi:hypothetical protein
VKVDFSFAQQAANKNIPAIVSYPDTAKKMIAAERDSFNVEVRLVNESVLDKYRNDPAFNYDLKRKETDDWITKLKYWLNQQLALIRTSKAFTLILDYLYYIIAVLALIIVIRGFIKADRSGFLFGKISANKIKLNESDENIDQLDFESLISSAINSKQYKLAVRYLFLKSLKLLSDNQFIEIKNHKTNNQYLNEIKNTKVAAAFESASNTFEWIWYGDFPVDDKLIRHSRNEFNNLFGLLKD